MHIVFIHSLFGINRSLSLFTSWAWFYMFCRFPACQLLHNNLIRASPRVPHIPSSSMFLRKKRKKSSPRVPICLSHLWALGKSSPSTRKNARTVVLHIRTSPRHLLLPATTSCASFLHAIVEVPSGERIRVAGKSTLLEILAGLFPCTRRCSSCW